MDYEFSDDEEEEEVDWGRFEGFWSRHKRTHRAVDAMAYNIGVLWNTSIDFLKMFTSATLGAFLSLYLSTITPPERVGSVILVFFITFAGFQLLNIFLATVLEDIVSKVWEDVFPDAYK